MAIRVEACPKPDTKTRLFRKEVRLKLDTPGKRPRQNSIQSVRKRFKPRYKLPVAETGLSLYADCQGSSAEQRHNHNATYPVYHFSNHSSLPDTDPPSVAFEVANGEWRVPHLIILPYLSHRLGCLPPLPVVQLELGVPESGKDGSLLVPALKDALAQIANMASAFC